MENEGQCLTERDLKGRDNFRPIFHGFGEKDTKLAEGILEGGDPLVAPVLVDNAPPKGMLQVQPA